MYPNNSNSINNGLNLNTNSNNQNSNIQDITDIDNIHIKQYISSYLIIIQLNYLSGIFFTTLIILVIAKIISIIHGIIFIIIGQILYTIIKIFYF